MFVSDYSIDVDEDKGDTSSAMDVKNGCLRA
jgi:hypothetical protein